MISETRPKDFNPVVDIVGCFVNHAGKTLMLKRHPEKFCGNMWACPGGKRESGEDLLLAAIREVYEESGIRIENEDVSFVGQFYDRYPGFDFNYFIYSCDLKSLPDIRLSEKEHSSYVWITPSEALKLELMPDEDWCIKKVFL